MLDVASLSILNLLEVSTPVLPVILSLPEELRVRLPVDFVMFAPATIKSPFIVALLATDSVDVTSRVPIYFCCF